MRLTWKRDGIATVLLAVILVFYGFLVAAGGLSLGSGGSLVGVVDPTGMAALALIVGVLAAVIGGWIVLRATDAIRYVTGGLALVSAVLGVLALVGENIFSSDVWYAVLGAFIGTIVLLWAVATGRHAGLFGGSGAASPTPV